MLSLRPLGAIPGAASSIFVRRFAKPACPPRQVVPSLQQLYDLADGLFPGQMQSLENNCIQKVLRSPRRALLQEIESWNVKTTGELIKQLTESGDQYTPKMNSLFLRAYPASEPPAPPIGRFDDKYMRLGVTKGNGHDPILHDVEHSFHEGRALRLALLLNRLAGSVDLAAVDYKIPEVLMAFEMADRELETRLMFQVISSFIRCLFSFTCYRYTDMDVQLIRGGLTSGAGIPDLTLRVEANSTKNKFTECLAIFEFRQPNAGLWIPWTLLTRQGWTDEERSAFFELQNIQLDKETQRELRRRYGTCREDMDFRKLFLMATVNAAVNGRYDSKDWVTDNKSDGFDPGTWSAASEALDLIGTKGVEYRKDGYFINGDENITQLLQAARFKSCFDDFHSALSNVTNYATLSNCNRVVIADGLTVIAGSLHQLAASSSPKVLDVDFHSTAMIQTHDQDSMLYMIRYLCDAAMSSSVVRSLAYQILMYAKELFPDGEITEYRQENLWQRIVQHDFSFDPEEHCPTIGSLQQSIPLLTGQARELVEKALCDLDAQGMKMKSKQTSSDAFTIVEWFEEDIYQDMDEMGPTYGHSKSVAKVQRRGDTTGRYYVLKEYFGDEDSVDVVKRKVAAYLRVDKLAEGDKKNAVELVEFGSLDLYTGIPRLYLLLEYVEGEKYVDHAIW